MPEPPIYFRARTLLHRRSIPSLHILRQIHNVTKPLPTHTDEELAAIQYETATLGNVTVELSLPRAEGVIHAVRCFKSESVERANPDSFMAERNREELSSLYDSPREDGEGGVKYVWARAWPVEMWYCWIFTYV